MAEIELIHQRDQLLYPDVLFNRPISGLARLQVALFGAKSGHIHTLSQTYSTVTALGLSPVCVVEKKLSRDAPMPVGSMLMNVESKGKSQIAETADVLDYIAMANLAILAPDIELSSALQLLFEHIFSQTSTPVIITDELVSLYGFLPRASRQRDEVLLCLSPAGLVKLAGVLKLPIAIRPGRGIYNTLTIMDAIAAECRAHVVCATEDMLVVRDVADSVKRGVIHLSQADDINQGLLLGLLGGILADSRQSFSGVLQKVMTAGYLYNAASVALEHEPDPAQHDRVIARVLQQELS